MPQPDYEDDLVFPPKQEKIKNLTDDWKAGKLEGDYYYFKHRNGDVRIGWFEERFIYEDGYCNEDVIEVLDPCDYNHIVELTEKVKAQKEELDQLKEENIKHLRYIGGLINEGSDLLNLLKDVKKEFTDISTMACYPDTNLTQQADFDNLFKKCENILTRINAAIGESE